jgi:hypothetical protein
MRSVLNGPMIILFIPPSHRDSEREKRKTKLMEKEKRMIKKGENKKKTGRERPKT